MELIQEIRNKASKKDKHIVLPEGDDIRTLAAAKELSKEKICRTTLLGNQEKIKDLADQQDIDLKEINIIDSGKSEHVETFADRYFELRKHKGISRDDAIAKTKEPLVFAAMMVESGVADGSVAGANHSTGDVLRAGIQCLGMKPGISVVSSTFLMLVPNWGTPLTFADGGVVPDPTDEQLASIAIASAHTHQQLTGEEAVVAMLSFSTKGSADHPLVDRVKSATSIVKKMAPDLKVDGELQLDAAIMPEIGKKKAPGSSVAGHANVLIFPNLDAGNIGYKLTQRLAGATALGPLIQGLNKPVMDLSRGCSASDIVDVSAICCLLGD